MPISVFFILSDKKIHPSYKMNFSRKIILGIRMYSNTLNILTGTSFRSHLSMAVKILEAPPDIKGDIVECGTWKGGSAVNLSLVCKIVGRKLKIYDSFEGLPEALPEDKTALPSSRGFFCGSLEEVKSNIAKYGELDCCEFIEGWYQDTLPKIKDPILLGFLDVDFQASLDICVRCIWPNLVDKGYLFIDDYVILDNCALFYSEKYWEKYFQRHPPGLIGAGSGLSLGGYFIGPWQGIDAPLLEGPTGPAYTRKDFSGHWNFYHDEK